MPHGDARSWSGAEQARVRLLAVQAVVAGDSQVATARRFGVTPRALSNWVRAYREAGAAGLGERRRGRRAGEQAAIEPWQQGQIVQAIRDRNPDQLRLPFVLWTREAVRDLIARRYGVRLSLSSVGRYLRAWGFTPQRPLRRAFEQDAAAVARWLQAEYPALRARAKRERAEILWGDEMGLRSDQAGGRSFAPRGQTPVIQKSGRRFGCNVIQAISNRGTLCFRVFHGRFSQDLFIDFLRRLIKQAAGRKLILIVDGHPAHRGKKARAFIARQGPTETGPGLLEVVHLPSYSPELNPAECLNNDTKHAVVTRRRPADQNELVGATRRHLHRRQKQPHIVARFFHEKHVAYAA